MQIAITGIGILSAKGLTTGPLGRPVGAVSLPDQDEVLSRNIRLGRVALREALDDAHLSAADCARMPLINGTTVGGMDQTEQHIADWIAGKTANLSLLRQHEAAETGRKLAELCGLKDSTTLSTACSSALNALIHGAGLIRTGATERVVVGGTEALTLFHQYGFASLGILSEHICRPFEPDRDGINLGEGAAYLVIEDAQRAQKRGAHIYGYLAGYGNACDAYHPTASSPEGDGALAAMQGAVRMAGLQPEQIPYINAHGTGTPNNDASELRAIERLYAGSPLPIIESTKTKTGHTTSASGSIEAILSLRRMEEEHYPYALSNAFGFGGNDSSIVLSASPITLPAISPHGAIHETTVQCSHGEWDSKEYIPPMEARRMTPMTRQLVVAAHRAIGEAGRAIDGIVVGTRWGGMVPTWKLLQQLATNDEQNFSPSHFMASTHNAAAGILARHLHCTGYNTTVVSNGDTLAAARTDAELALRTGLAGCILVCTIDELPEVWNGWCEAEGIATESVVKAQVVWYD